MTKFYTPILVLLGLAVSSCGKKEETPAAQPKAAALTLPLTVDFASVTAQGQKSLTVGGLDFTGAGVVSSDYNTNGFVQCLASTGSTMRGTGKVTIAYTDFNCLIADVSKLPAMQKITVTLFDNGRPSTQLVLCDGNSTIATSKTYTGANPTVVYTLPVGGKTASKLYIHSLEADVKSIVFE